jgi:hypothetical protein
MSMPTPEVVAAWLPKWHELIDAALASAADPAAEPVALRDLADRAAGDHKHVGAWPSPFSQQRDQYVGAALIWTAKAFARQGSGPMRQTLADALHANAMAFKARLARAVEARPALVPPAPVLRFRPRRDIDDVDDGEG